MSTLATSSSPAAAPPPPAKALIMIVEDTPFWQKQIGQAMRAAGYATVLAGNGAEALELLATHKPSLVISDIEMPRMTGLEFLNALRTSAQWQQLPVILLTTGAVKERIVEAKRLNAAEYMLKGSFSADQLADRANKWLARPAKAPAPPAPPKPVASAFPRLLQSGQARAGVVAQVAAGKTLAAVASQTLALCDASPTNPAALLDIVKYDPILAMRVIQAANTTKRVGTIDDAVRAIGADAIRTIAASLTAYTTTSRGALSAWQHSMAVAAVMHKIVPRSFEVNTGVAYLVGLLHDLPEILLRQAFPAQYEAALDFADQASKPLRHIAPDIFSLSMADIAAELAALLKLPPIIATALREYAVAMAVATHDAGRTGPMVDRLALAIRFAEYYANALRLPLTSAPSDAFIAPLTVAECRAAYVSMDPINGAEIRANALAACAKLNGADLPAAPETTPRPKLWYTRHNTYAALDPVEEALKQFADVETHPEPPAKREHFASVDGVIVCAPAFDSFGLLWHLPDRMPQDGATRPAKILYVVPHPGPNSKRPPGDHLGVLQFPFSLASLQTALHRFK